MDTKKKHNVNNIISWIATFILLASAIASVVNYIDLKSPTIQVTAIFIAGIIITVVFMLIMWLDSIQLELHDIKESLDDLYDLKQINGLRSTVDKRHIDKLLNDIKKILMIHTMEKKTNEENKD